MQRISYFGPAGTFTEAALVQMEALGTVHGEAEHISAASPPAALDMVRSGQADMACVPIESSVEGPVVPTLDALARGDRLQIIADTELAIAFAVAARPGTVLADVRTVAAYPVAAAQVSAWLDTKMGQAKLVPAASNAAAADDVAAGRADAAVSTTLAARQRGLEVLADEVADVEGARTSFVLVSAPVPPPPRTGRDRTSIVLSLPNEPGSLAKAMNEFALRGIDLSRLQSRPTRTGMGTYRFYLDCIGHIDDPAVGEALKALHRGGGDVRFLGSWPTVVAGGCPPPDDSAASAWLERVRRGDRTL
ncbi:prephenate dehydratase [Hoyosella sp. YIM 151337]|uniref:prephenate dehydratase n=1 Tax=Hoyosella sp. YIM 151337 TaxID=2992742 RepID=UPI002235A67D|nr:prephenate dehydratase [Hoyosella sp. YIM 151337]MCW4354643.1 prephenate dehydratase [Hoyosella sp. YIM 151337]